MWIEYMGRWINLSMVQYIESRSFGLILHFSQKDSLDILKETEHGQEMITKIEDFIRSLVI